MDAAYLTRTEAGRLLGVSRERVRQLETQGKLPRPVRNDAGHAVHRKEDVLALAVRRGKPINLPGDIAAQLFAHFQRGATFDDIVIATKCAPELVRQMRKQYEQGFDDPPATAVPETEEDLYELRRRERRERRTAAR